jgi:hypothetical protein
MGKTTRKKSAIVPAVVFSTVIAASVPVAADLGIPFSVADFGFRD